MSFFKSTSMKVSFVCTVLNEGKTIKKFLRSIIHQTRGADEIIIVDGGSSDDTVSQILSFKSQGILGNKKITKKKIRDSIRLLIKKGNRSIGRNHGIQNANGSVIAIADVGCILDKNWIKNITVPFKNTRIGIVAGFYKGLSKTLLQKCLIPYVLIMPDRVRANKFLPSSRSMAIRKNLWKKLGGFPEKYSHNEDYVFAKKAQSMGCKIEFVKEAIVFWIPPNSLKLIFIMFYRFAFGDIESRIIRPKVVLLFARYIVFFYLLFLASIIKSLQIYAAIIVLMMTYVAWTILKNYRYVKDNRSLLVLPVLQIVSDAAVLSGSVLGLIKLVVTADLLKLLRENRFIFLVIIVYIVCMISVIKWGIPNMYHPFTYHMDEWHFSQTIRALFNYGTATVSGSANIPFFHIVSSIFFVAPFVLAGIVNPLEISSSIASLDVQEKLFMILRLHTLFYGVISVIFLYVIAKKFLKINYVSAVIFFVFSPLLLSLSNYYKYDVMLVCLILIHVFFVLRFNKAQKIYDYFTAGVFAGLALSTKFSATPLIPLYIVSYFLFAKVKKTIHPLIGIGIIIVTFGLFGIPDFLFGGGNYSELLSSNLVRSPQLTENFLLGAPYVIFLLFIMPFTIFGFVEYFLFLLSVPFFVVFLFNRSKIEKTTAFLLLGLLLFFLSIVPLKIYAGGNRLAVLLPFIALIIGLTIRYVFSISSGLFKKIAIVLLAVGIIIQVVESYAWVLVKQVISPQEASSQWLVKNIPHQTEIGVENIPIYQSLPDIVLREFYEKQYRPSSVMTYRYTIVSSQTKTLPKTIILTNDEAEQIALKESDKNLLSRRLKNEKYEKIAQFKPNYFYYKFLGTEQQAYITGGLSAMPLTITIYQKDSLRN